MQEQNPESSNKTVYYYYDSYPSGTCWSSGATAGDLLSRVDGAQNTTCFLYDGLHRLTDAAGWQNKTWFGPCRRYRYDSSSNGIIPTPSGVTVANVVGRIVEAETDNNCAGGSGVTTDEWFSYDADGRTTDVWESTPKSGGYYHSTAGYWENDAIKSLSPGVPNNQVTLPWTYGVDGEGRLYSSSNSTGTSIKSATYYPSGQVNTITHSNGDNDAYTYDPADMMKTYTSSIGTGPTTVTGTLTWNANGTLQQLNIVDGFNSADSQTCTYSADDLVRIASVSCGSAWSQTFSYDAFGNISKSGSISWACTACYNEATNQYNSALSPQIQYDANGNLLNDSLHTYTWDANWGNPTQIDSTTYTYDALGRMAEFQTGTNAASQIMYGPLGKAAIMTGQTEVQSFQPLPGGGTIVHRPGSLTNYWRHPEWLGSSRLATTLPGRTKFYDTAYAPFGENYVSSGTTDLDFTGQTQDSISSFGGLYDFPYREYAPREGRWLTPDPAGSAVANPTNPQSWNRYAYVVNNSLSLVDPSGNEGKCVFYTDCPTHYESFGYGCAGIIEDCPDSGEEGGLGSITWPDLYSDEPAILWLPRSGQGIFEGENSLNWPIGSGSVLTDLWQDALGLPTLPCQSQFGPWCNPSMLPNPWISEAGVDPTTYGKNFNCKQFAGDARMVAIDSFNPSFGDIFKTPDFVEAGIAGALGSISPLLKRLGGAAVASGFGEAAAIALGAAGIYNYAEWSNKYLAPFEERQNAIYASAIQQCDAQFPVK